jgi:acetyltransferase-like isoleucine patch superfamily enzyme
MSRLKYFLRRPLQLPIVIITRLPFFRFIRKTLSYNTKITFEIWFKQKVLNWGGNKHAYWPVHWTSRVMDADKIWVGVDSYPGLNGGAYITGTGGLNIGSYCFFAKNIIIVTANHDPYDLRIRIASPIAIGDYCWLGAGAKIMPGVTLGDFTVVAAGAVVTSSFPEGYVVLGGIPAKVIRKLEPELCVKYQHPTKFYGYLDEHQYNERKAKFDSKQNRRIA